MPLQEAVANLPEGLAAEEIQRVWDRAAHFHDSTGCTYDGASYMVHIGEVLHNALRYITLLPVERRQAVISAVILHDVEEDCRLTFNDIKKEFGHEVAELVHAVTNHKGRDRVERALLTYVDVRRHVDSVFIKLVDRLANCKHSMGRKTGMGNVYAKEHPIFRYALYRSDVAEFHVLDPVWAELEEIVNGHQPGSG